MPAIIVTILTGFATYLSTTLLARVASLVVFSTISTVGVTGLLNSAMSSLGSAGDVAFMIRLAGFGEAFSIIGSAILLRATINAWSMRPSSAITGGN